MIMLESFPQTGKVLEMQHDTNHSASDINKSFRLKNKFNVVYVQYNKFD